MLQSKPHTYPLLDFAYARALLLQADLTPIALNTALGVSDPLELDALVGRHGKKMAKRWAPLLVHFALHDPDFPCTPALRDALEDCETTLQGAEHLSWLEQYRAAAAAGIPPLVKIKATPLDQKKRLLSERRAWTLIGNKLESRLAKGIVESHSEIANYLASVGERKHQVSLKRLAKFKPRAH